ncbi:MAG: glycine--tRNA ligase [Patescibacteria group bacterium]
MSTPDNKEQIFQNLISFCKRKGFVFPSSEIYGGFAAVYDYGHYGVLLKNNIRDSWWRAMVQLRGDMIGLDSAIFMHPKAWVASGHVGGFNDPQVDCKKCKERYRADHLLKSYGVEADKAPLEFINEQLNLLRDSGKLKCAKCGSTDLTEARIFSLMVKSNIGSPVGDLKDEDIVYLRPETCGGIYLNYKNTLDSSHPSIPFGIAQVGKAFRNEITARQFIFRTREFEQMEMQYFVYPDTVPANYEMWQKARWQWYLDNGIPEQKLKWYKHEKLAHYASEAYDVEYDFACLGSDEVEGIHARGNWDLSQHAKFSGQDLSYFDTKTNERFVPHIVETSVGLNRLVLMFLDFAYTEEAVGEDTRIVLKLPKHLAPIKVAIFPLLKNKPDLVAKAQEIYNNLKSNFMCEFDDNGNVGKRYRRQDEIGTPYCVTVDFETLEDEMVTVRNRDTMTQERIKISELESYLVKNLKN